MDGYAVIDSVSRDKGIPRSRSRRAEKNSGKAANRTSRPIRGGRAVGHADDRAPQAHAKTPDRRRSTSGILDSGIDATPRRLLRAGIARRGVERRLRRGRVSVESPSLGRPEPCVDTGFHGTHVVGTSPHSQRRRHRRRRSRRDARAGDGLRGLRVLVERGRRRHHLRRGHQARRHQHELLHRRREHDRRAADGVQPGGHATVRPSTARSPTPAAAA